MSKLDKFQGKKKELLIELLKKLGYADVSEFESLNDAEVEYVLKFVDEYGHKGATGMYDILWDLDYHERPVGVEEFVGSERYLGRIGDLLYAPWKEELSYVLAPDSKIIEWIFTGAVGTGKTTVSNVAQLYKLYCLMCIKNPVEYYGLMGEGVTTLALGLFNVNLKLAKSVNYNQFKAILQTSSWFNERVTHNQENTWIKFTDDIVITLGSRNTHALGKAVIGGAMDEADFTDSVEYKETVSIYNSLKRRMSSRFRDYMYTRPPGLLTLISSTVQDDQSFINQRIEIARANEQEAHISQFAEWDVKPVPPEMDKGKFYVFIGDTLHPAKILEGDEEDEYKDEQVIGVPEIYRQTFVEDIDTALMDVAGVRTGTKKSSFLRNMSMLDNCMKDRDTLHPFKAPSIPITIDDPTDIKSYFDADLLFKDYKEKNNKRGPIVNPHVPRFIHVDLSKSGDATGIACVHCDGFQDIEEDIIGTDYSRKLRLPKYYVDFMLQINSTVGSEIDFSKIRDFIFFLHANGMKIGGISYDSWQSVDSLQHYEKSKLTDQVDTISVDRTHEPYSLLRSLIMTTRISCYNHEVFVREIKELLRNPDTKKCDHPKLGSKDVADGVTGAIFHCNKFYRNYRETPDMPLKEMTDYMAKEKPVVDQDFHLPRRKKGKLNI